jgi:hypothetical protein
MHHSIAGVALDQQAAALRIPLRPGFEVRSGRAADDHVAGAIRANDVDDDRAGHALERVGDLLPVGRCRDISDDVLPGRRLDDRPCRPGGHVECPDVVGVGVR